MHPTNYTPLRGPRYALLLTLFVVSALLAVSLPLATLAQAAAGDLDPNFLSGLAGANNTVRAMALQPDGKIVIGGRFTQVNGTARNFVARLNADGSLDSTFDPGSGPNYEIGVLAVQADGKILIGGWFTQVDGTSRDSIARLNTDGSLDTSFYSIVNGVVRAIVPQSDGKILVGGWFDEINATSRNSIGRLNPDGSLDTGFDPGSGADAAVATLVLQQDGKVIIGGDFTLVNGIVRNGNARLNPDGSLDTGFDPGAGANGRVATLALQQDGKVIIGGYFTQIDGTSRNSIARLNTDGSIDSSFDPGTGIPEPVEALAVQSDGRVVVGGSFVTVNDIERRGIARLNADGSVDTNFNPGSGASGTVFSIARQPDGKIIISGLFTEVDSTTRNRIARLLQAPGELAFTAASDSVDEDASIATIALRRTGGGDGTVTARVDITGGTASAADYRFRPGALDASFDPGAGVNGDVNTLALQPDGKIVIGGLLDSVNGIPRYGVARLNTDGTLDIGFDTGMGVLDYIHSLALQPDGKVIIGGLFGMVDTTLRNSIARLHADGSLDTTFTATTNSDGDVFALVVQPDSKIIAGGIFSTMNGTPRSSIARLNLDSSLDTTFNASIDGTVLALTLQPDGKILAGGEFNLVNGIACRNVARLNADGSLESCFPIGASVSDAVHALTLQPDGKIIAGGQFHTVNGTPRTNIARLNADGSLDTSFDPGSGTDDYVWEVVLQPDGKVIMGGQFTSVNGAKSNYIARLHTDGTLDSTFDLGTGPDSNVFGLAVQPDGKVVIGGSFLTVGGTSYSGIARLEGDLLATWPAGDTADKAITLPIVDDTLAEGEETVALTLTPLTGGATAGTPASFTLTIVDNDDAAPTITEIVDQSTSEDIPTSPISFTVGDTDTAADSLIVSGSSSNQALVPDANIVFSGAGTSLTLSIAPASNQHGTATITITVSDGSLTATESFVLTVTPVNDAPTLGTIADISVDESASAQAVSLSGIGAGAPDEVGQTLAITASSSNPALIPHPTVSYTSPSATGILSVVPISGMSGSATITVIVTDSGSGSAPHSNQVVRHFAVFVGSVNNRPTLGELADLTILEDAGVQPINLSGISAGSVNEAGQSLTITATSSNSALIPSPTVTYSSPSAIGTLSMSPVPNASGTATLSVTVQDNGGASNGGIDTITRSFVVTVLPINDAPSFIAGGDQQVEADAGPQIVAGWATSFTPGPADEAGQTALSYQVVGNSNPALFSAPPAISLAGTLTYTPRVGASGTATIRVIVRDSGGTANGGVDTSVEEIFTIRINDGYKVYLPLVTLAGHTALTHGPTLRA